MNEPIVSVKEMINYIYEKCKENGYSISHETIEVILDYEEQFLDCSKASRNSSRGFTTI